jgi:hypothetical protein
MDKCAAGLSYSLKALVGNTSARGIERLTWAAAAARSGYPSSMNLCATCCLNCSTSVACIFSRRALCSSSR